MEKHKKRTLKEISTIIEKTIIEINILKKQQYKENEILKENRVLLQVENRKKKNKDKLLINELRNINISVKRKIYYKIIQETCFKNKINEQHIRRILGEKTVKSKTN
ncbi:hypothetical protein PL373_06100 [Tenacibaculum maritimum]|nr:hypothetical protein [Tenacibaculum maritimum]MDB0600723.1 hypothetical protein [Tenacibaculum maritimum]MDB0612706.1 hypothetical protein [Tenacibaculum maritimum]